MSSKGQIPLHYPGCRQVRGWSQTGPKLAQTGPRLVSDLQRASRSATSFRPICDQDSVIKFCLDQLRTGLRPGSSRFELSRRIEIARIARTRLNLVEDRFAAGLSKILLRYPGRR